MKSLLKPSFYLFCIMLLIFAGCGKDDGNAPNFAVINIGKDTLYANQEASFNIVYNSTSKLKGLKIEETLEGGSTSRTVKDSAWDGGYTHDFVVKYKVPDTLKTNKIKLKFTVTREDKTTGTAERTLTIRNGQITFTVSADKTEAKVGETVMFTLTGNSEVDFKKLLINEVDTISGIATLLKDSTYNSGQIKALNYIFNYKVPSNAVVGKAKTLKFSVTNFLNLQTTETKIISIK